MRRIQGTSQADPAERAVVREGFCGDVRGHCPCKALCVRHPYDTLTLLDSGDAGGHACLA
jgi:hypothetical protein